MYEVIRSFVDGENGIPYAPKNGGFGYSQGEQYPKGGFEPTKEHIAYLKGKGNAFGEALIKEIKPSKAENRKE